MFGAILAFFSFFTRQRFGLDGFGQLVQWHDYILFSPKRQLYFAACLAKIHSLILAHLFKEPPSLLWAAPASISDSDLFAQQILTHFRRSLPIFLIFPPILLSIFSPLSAPMRRKKVPAVSTAGTFYSAFLSTSCSGLSNHSYLMRLASSHTGSSHSSWKSSIEPPFSD